MGFMEVRVRSDIDIDYRTVAALRALCGGMARRAPIEKTACSTCMRLKT